MKFTVALLVVMSAGALLAAPLALIASIVYLAAAVAVLADENDSVAVEYVASCAAALGRLIEYAPAPAARRSIRNSD